VSVLSHPVDPRRDLAIEGAYNVRDLGGYQAGHGRTVKWRHVYRSDALGAATANDVELLLARGIRLVCDLRSGLERTAAPNPWIATTSIESWGQPPTESVGDSRQLLSNCLVSAEATRAVMTESYRVIPFDQARAYSQVFRRLAARDTPLLFHCFAGKDRSGVAAALLLDVLGVPREAIVADYLLSNRVHERIRSAFLADPRHVAAVNDLNESWLPLMEADPAYLEAMFDAVELRRGSVEAYFRKDLGIGAEALSMLREHLLE